MSGDPLHLAICNSRDAGVTYVVAAGNDAFDASSSVPAAYDDAVIAVCALADSDGRPGGLGAPTSSGADDDFASFSNWGAQVALGAPSVNILSTVPTTGCLLCDPTGYRELSGTSMAAPHVAGAAALYLKAHPGTVWWQVRDALVLAGEALTQRCAPSALGGACHVDSIGLHTLLGGEPILKVTGL